jgi:hypothetical protein
MESIKKYSTLKIVLVTLGGVAIVIIIVVGVSLYSDFSSLNSFNANDKPVIMAQVDQLISDINQGNVDNAYKLIDPKYFSLAELQKDIPMFQKLFQGYIREDSNFQSENITSSIDGNKVTYQTTIYFSDNTQGTLAIVANQENGKWEIGGLNVMDPSTHISK